MSPSHRLIAQSVIAQLLPLALLAIAVTYSPVLLQPFVAVLALAGVLVLLRVPSGRAWVLRPWRWIPGFASVGQQADLIAADLALRRGDSATASAIAERIAASAGNPVVAAGGHYTSARAHADRAEWEAALADATRAGELAATGGNRFLTINALNVEGVVASSRRDFDRAEAAYRRVLAEVEGRRGRRRAIEFIALYNLGWTAWQRHHHAAAAGYFIRAESRLNRTARALSAGPALVALGLARVDIREGRTGDARARIAGAREVARRWRDVHVNATIALVESSLAMREGRFGDAAAAAEEALRLRSRSETVTVTMLGLYALAAYRGLPDVEGWLSRAQRAAAGLGIPELEAVVTGIERDPGLGLEWAADLDVGIEPLLKKERRLPAASGQPPR